MRWVAAVFLVCVLAGCTTSVTGDGAAPTTTTSAPLPPPPTSIDVNATQQYCPGTFTGALGKPMNAVVVATAGGRVHCEEAFSVLVHYYQERPEPDAGSEPLEVDGYACNQVPEPDQPQVICADDVSLFYSMWVQGG